MFGVCYHEADRILLGCALHQIWFQPDPGLTGTRAADDKNILISGSFGICWPVVHGQAFCLGEDDVISKHRVDIGLDVLSCTPPGRAIFHVLSEFLCVLALSSVVLPHTTSTGHRFASARQISEKALYSSATSKSM